MASLYELFIKISGDNSSFKKSVSEASTALADFAGVSEATATKIADIGTKLLGGLSFTAIGASILKTAEDFEKAGFRIQQSTGATGAKLDGLKDSLKALYQTSAQNADNIGAAMSSITIKTGATGAALEYITKASLQFAKVTGTDVKSSVDTTQRVFAQWQITLSQQPDMMDRLLVASQKSGVGMAKFGETLLTVSPMLRQMGFSFDAGAALVANFEKHGLDAGAVIQSLRLAMNQWAKAGEDPSKMLADLIDKMTAAGTNAEALTLATQAHIRGAALFTDAVRAGVFATDDLQKAMASSSGAVQKTAQDTQTLGEKWTILWHQLQGIIIPAGKLVVDFGSGAAESLSHIVNSFRDAGSAIESYINSHPIVATVMGFASLKPPESQGTSTLGTLGSVLWSLGANRTFGPNPPAKPPLIYGPTMAQLTAPVPPPNSTGTETEPGAPDLVGSHVRPTPPTQEMVAFDQIMRQVYDDQVKADVVWEKWAYTPKQALAGWQKGMKEVADEFPPVLNGAAKAGEEFDALTDAANRSDAAMLKQLAADPYGQLAKSAEYFGITTSAEMDRVAKASKQAFDAMLKSGLATERDLAIAALKTAQAEIDADLAAGRISEEQHAKESARIKQDLKDWEGSINSKLSSLQKWAIQVSRVVGSVGKSFHELGRIAADSFASLTRGMGSAIADAIVYQDSIGAAMQAAVASVMAGIAAQAIAYAIYATALGFLRLAQWDFAAATAAFTSAAIWGTVGVATAAIGQMIAPKNQQGTHSAAGGWESVPFDNAPALLHKNEMVLPADIAVPMRQMVRGGGTSTGGLHVHIANMYGVTKETVHILGNQMIRQARLAGARL